MDADPDAARALKWRDEIRESVQEIIYPITISWMDDDGAMSEGDYAQRAVDDVKARFERSHYISFVIRKSDSNTPRQLVDSDAASRIALLDQLAEFICAVSSCKPDLTQHSKQLTLSTLPAGLSVVARFLDGTEDELSPGVRRRAYTILSNAIKHHTITPERDGLAHASNTILRGVVDPDRSVRLGAG